MFCPDCGRILLPTMREESGLVVAECECGFADNKARNIVLSESGSAKA